MFYNVWCFYEFPALPFLCRKKTTSEWKNIHFLWMNFSKKSQWSTLQFVKFVLCYFMDPCGCSRNHFHHFMVTFSCQPHVLQKAAHINIQLYIIRHTVKWRSAPSVLPHPKVFELSCGDRTGFYCIMLSSAGFIPFRQNVSCSP